MMNDSNKLIVGTGKLSKILEVSPSTIRRWAIQGMPGQRFSTGRWQFYLGEIYIWLLIQHRSSKSNKWGPRYRKISNYVNELCPYGREGLEFHSYTFKKREEYGLNGPKCKRRRI